MSLLSVVQDVCGAVGVLMPTTVMSGINANRTMQEMLALANEMAQRIAYDTREWTALMTAAQIPGDGVATSFLLPANFKRMMLNTNVYRLSSPTQPMRFIPDYNEWVSRGLSYATNSAYGEWIIIGGSIYVRPTVSSTDTLHFTYLDKNCVNIIPGGGVGDRFLNDTDTFRLDERLLKLGMTWQWKANKGTSYAEDMGTFTDALAMAMAHDKPAPIYIGRRPLSDSAKTAIPTQTIYFPGATP
jgi:hypothetical protein